MVTSSPSSVDFRLSQAAKSNFTVDKLQVMLEKDFLTLTSKLKHVCARGREILFCDAPHPTPPHTHRSWLTHGSGHNLSEDWMNCDVVLVGKGWRHVARSELGMSHNEHGAGLEGGG